LRDGEKVLRNVGEVCEKCDYECYIKAILYDL